MRFFALSVVTSFWLARLCVAQTIDVKPPPQEPVLPAYRPALVGSGAGALINRIDEKALIKKGQTDAAVMFACVVTKSGEIVWTSIDQATTDSKVLQEELLKQLKVVKFIPGVFNHVPVNAVFFGTVTFAVVDGKPRLRIFSNQEKEEVKKESDFIAPQPFIGNESRFDGWHYPTENKIPVAMTGNVDLEVEVSDQGVLTGINVLDEQPPLAGFGEAAALDTAKARFIPAFRGGKPVASKVTLSVRFNPSGELFSAPLGPQDAAPRPD